MSYMHKTEQAKFWDYAWTQLKLRPAKPVLTPEETDLPDLDWYLRIRDHLRTLNHIELLNYLCDRANNNLLDFDDNIWYDIAREVAPDLDWDGVHITYRYLSQESFDYYGVTECTWCFIMKMGGTNS